MNYTHLRQLTTEHGIFEHCDGQSPLPEHGFCVDDVARAIVVVERDGHLEFDSADLVESYLDFLEGAQMRDGSVINRRSAGGLWNGDSGLGDHWGRALWAWGSVVGRSDDVEHVERSIEAFRRSGGRRSPFLRSMAHAALGAAEYLRRFPRNSMALDLLADVRDSILRPVSRSIPWPEERLTYANAILPQALIEAGVHLGDSDTLARGLEMLGWLIGLQTQGSYLSPISNAGWGPGDPLPAFDQQPIEVAHLVDACVAAFDATGDARWLAAIRLGGLWFYGVNDVGVWMHDPRTGGGYDGLTEEGRNENCGAESTLAYLSTMGQLMGHRDVLRTL